MERTILAADLFAGAGGTSTGLYRAADALGLAVQLLAINHWPTAVATHAANHPSAEHRCVSVDSVDPRTAVPGGRLDLLVASPECFPAGTLVLTEHGYEPIELIETGTMVLTHKNRWRRVTARIQSTENTIVLEGQGHPGLEVTPNHPVYARTAKQYHRISENAGYCRNLSEPQWIRAVELPKKCLWAVPRHITPLPVPSVGGRGFEFSQEFWWMIGLWLAEGTARIRSGSGSEITISCAKYEADEIGQTLSCFASDKKRCGSSELRWRRRDIGTATLFETGQQGLVEWLVDNFGKLATGKRLPAWVYGMPEEDRQALLDGYLYGDGHVEQKSYSAKQTCQTVSKQLAYGIKTLAATLGFRPSVHVRTPFGDTIEGRTVNIHPAWGVHWTKAPARRDGYDDGDHYWTLFKAILPGRDNVEVYNLSVDEDESYVVEGIVVHNCTHFSRARGGRPRSNQSRASVWQVLHWAQLLKIESILIENVREFVEWGPLDEAGAPIQRLKGKTYLAFLDALRSLDYTVEARVLNCADYGDPTTRERLFILARRGEQPIRWPEPTHRRRTERDLLGDQRPGWRSAREIIDWSVPGESIFNRRRPLSPNTLKRIEAGLRRYSGLPFVLGQQSCAAPRAVSEPLPTVAAAGAVALIEPFLVQYHGSSYEGGERTSSVNAPLPTVATSNQFGLAEPFLVVLNGTREDQLQHSARSVDEPAPTLVGSPHVYLAQPFIIKYNGTGQAHSIDEPLDTVTGKDRFGLVVSLTDGRQALLDIRFRMLQPHELAAAMSFPADYSFTGTREQRVKQIGNAVPVRTAEALCKALLTADKS